MENFKLQLQLKRLAPIGRALRQMWRRGAGSSALDRAEALLTARRSSSRHVHRGTEDSLGGSFKPRSAPSDKHSLFSNVSELCYDSLTQEHGADTDRSADAEVKHSREGDSNKDFRLQSTLGEWHSFMKKAPQPQSPDSRNQKQQALEPQYMSFSQCEPQTATSSQLDEITSQSCKQALNQAGQRPKAAFNLTSEFEISPTPASQSTETSSKLSACSKSKQSHKETRLLKKKAAGTNAAPAVAPTHRAAGIRSRFRSFSPTVSSRCLGLKSWQVKRGVDLESDEEDIRKLLGDSMDSDCSFSGTKKLSPSKAHFSPSVMSPSSSPPRISPSPSERLVSSYKAVNPQHSLSSPPGCGEVFFLDKLFSTGPSSEGPHSEIASASSEGFKINVMTLDELAPASNDFTSEHTGKENQTKKEEEQPQQQEKVLDYQSDFESDSNTSQVSEDLQGDEDVTLSEVRKVSEKSVVRKDSERSHDRTNNDYSNKFSVHSCSGNSWTSDCSHKPKPFSRRGSSRSSASQSSSNTFQQLKRRALKDAEVQTQPDPAGMFTLDSILNRIYMSPGPVVTHAISAERLEDISIFNPAAFVVNQVLKEQLIMMRGFIESSHHLHHSLLQKLEPPNYRYTTLEGTIQNIHEHRTPNSQWRMPYRR